MKVPYETYKDVIGGQEVEVKRYPFNVSSPHPNCYLSYEMMEWANKKFQPAPGKPRKLHIVRKEDEDGSAV